MMNQYNLQDKTGNKGWLAIIGIGEDGLDGLGKAAVKRLQEAEFVFGGERHLAFLGSDFAAKRMTWPKPFVDSIGKVRELKGRQVALLTSGDPMFYGAGAVFLHYFPLQEIDLYPHVSSFSLAAARLGWPLQNVECCSVHGRTLSGVLRFIENGTRLLVLANDGNTPAMLAAKLQQKGFAASRVTVLEHLGGAKERIVAKAAGAFDNKPFADLNIIAVDCICDRPGLDFSRFSTLPDHAFAHDGQLTKQDIRAVTLARLAPGHGELLWDVGAGCGSVSIEWMRLGRNAGAVAIEQNSSRCGYIRQNAANFGFPELCVVEGRAPSILHELKIPDAVFIGGGVSTPGIIDTCWQALKPGGRLVANAVTLEGEAVMTRWSADKQVCLLKLAVSASGSLGHFHVWRQSLPVTMLIAQKS